MRERMVTEQERVPMTPDAARLALAQATMDELCGVLAYAEGVGLVAAALGVGVELVTLIAAVLTETIDGTRPWDVGESFPAHLRGAIGDALRGRVWRRCEERGGPLGSRASHALLALQQLGSIAGILDGAHRFGETMMAIRARDGSTGVRVVALDQLIRARVGRLVASDAAPIAVHADADTPSLRGGTRGGAS